MNHISPGTILVKRFELALEKFHGAYADAYADAEDRGDAKRALKDAREALLAALTPGWQSIESAPEDELILVATTGGYVDTAHWTDDGDGVRWWWSQGRLQQLHQNLTPTHWIPLPKHPHA